MHAVVTGAAGFIGSHLCEYLLLCGDTVVAVDSFTDYYERERKEANAASYRHLPGARFVEADLLEADLDDLLEGADVVYHLAAQPGVRPSWGREFETYTRQNVMGTQRLLEACRERWLWKVVYASSSSVYGDAESYPTVETMRPQPVSPYGVSKLAAEHLMELYRKAFGIPTASLRLFTVYGPRQRPDMAFQRLVTAAREGLPFTVYGDGEQSRDFTYVGDVVAAMRKAALSTWTGVANIGGGSRTTMNEVVEIVASLTDGVDVHYAPTVTGDVRHTAADITVAREAFGYKPRTSLRRGLLAMVEAGRPAPSLEVTVA